MKYLLIISSYVLFSYAFASAEPFLECTRETEDFHYDLTVLKTSEFNSHEPWNFMSAHAKVSAVKVNSDRKKSVRNYNDSQISFRNIKYRQGKYTKNSTIYISLSSRATAYGHITLPVNPGKTVTAKLNLYEGATDRVLDLDCTLLKEPF